MGKLTNKPVTPGHRFPAKTPARLCTHATLHHICPIREEGMFGCIKSRPGRSAGRTKRDHPQRQIRSLLEGQTKCPEQDTAVSRNYSDGLALHCLLNACTVKWTRQRSTLYRRVLSSIYCTTRHGQRTAHCRKSCGEPMRTSNDSTLQKKLWGTTENLREQHTAEETGKLLKTSGSSTLQKKLGNYWRPQRAAHCRRSCEEPLRTSEGKHTAEVVWNCWCPQRAEHCRRNWGTTEDLNGHHIAEEAVGNLRCQHMQKRLWGTWDVSTCRRNREEPERANTAEEAVGTSEGSTLQKKLGILKTSENSPLHTAKRLIQTKSISGGLNKSKHTHFKINNFWQNTAKQCAHFWDTLFSDFTQQVWINYCNML